MKLWHKVFLLLIIILSVFVIFKNEVAWFVWEHYRWDNISFILSPDDSYLASMIGLYYFNGGNYNLEKVEYAYKQALLTKPNSKWGHYQLARVYFIQGNLVRARLEINKQIKKHPKYLRAHYVRGLIYAYGGYPGDIERAEKDFKRFIEWAPQEWAGYNDLAWVQIKQKHFDKALNTILSAFEHIPEEKKHNVWLWTNLGVAYLNLNDYNKAKDAFLNAQAISKTMTARFFWSAYPGNDIRNAENVFKQYRATLSLNLGIVYERLDELTNAKKLYNEYLTILPDGPFPKHDEIEKKIQKITSQIQ